MRVRRLYRATICWQQSCSTPIRISSIQTTTNAAFPDPTFKNVSRKNLIDILVELRIDTGDLVPFVGVGCTTVTLSFCRQF